MMCSARVISTARRSLVALGAATLLAACGGGGGSSSGSGSGSGGGGGYGGGGGTPPPASAFTVTKLVSDGAVAALTKDAKLVNPWGIAFGPNDPVWVANNGSQTSTLYDGRGTATPPVVNIPAGLNGAANPTGVVYNGGTGFMVSKAAQSGPALFIFDGEGGTLSGWAPGVDPTNAITMYDDGAGGAVYKGLAIAADSGGTLRLYAADFHNNKVDVFDSTWKKITVTGGFTDPTLPSGYAPFGIQALTVQSQTLIYVTYAKQLAPNNHDNVNGAGLGLVDVYDLQGTLKTHLIATGGKLDAPWGLALAPASFGAFGNDLLVGNFGDGWINAFDPVSGAFKGTLADASGQPIAYPGLWGIAFGNGAQNQPTTTLFFAAGIASEADGLYGRIDVGSSAPDLIPPSVSLSAPAANATVSGTVTVTATATDNVGVKSVQLLAGSTVLATLSAAPYSTQWDTTKVPNGAVTLTATATDAAGNSATSAAITVTVNNAAQQPVTLTQLQAAIFTPICSVCHTGMGTSLPGVMNLTAGHTHDSLVNVASIEQPALKRVLPGDPDNSYIIHKLEGTPGITGSRMPLGGPYLDQATINQVRTWITQGALNN